jgi:hypothetical protein
MKKSYYLIVLVLILGLVLTGCSLLSNVGQVPATEQSELDGIIKTNGTYTGPVTLWAGQNIDVGVVEVWNDGVELHVIYNTTDPWVMTETHLAVVTDINDFPTNKAGNPKVGHFPYGEENIFTDTWEEIIELSAIPAGAGQELFIAAHAVVADTSITMEEVVVSRPGIDVYGPLDDYAGLGDIIWGSANPAVATWVLGEWPSIPDATWISTSYLIGQDGGSISASSWRWFHDVMTLPEKGYYISGTIVLATSDNAEEVYFNGELVGSYGEVQGDFIDNLEWYTIIPYSIIPQPGLNTLDFIVRNYAGGSFTPESNPTGLIYKTTISYYSEESAWADGPRFTEKGNWATYFTYVLQPVQLNLLPWGSTVPIETGSGKVMLHNPTGDPNFIVQVDLEGAQINHTYVVWINAGGADLSPLVKSPTPGSTWYTLGNLFTNGLGDGSFNIGVNLVYSGILNNIEVALNEVSPYYNRKYSSELGTIVIN